MSSSPQRAPRTTKPVPAPSIIPFTAPPQGFGRRPRTADRLLTSAMGTAVRSPFLARKTIVSPRHPVTVPSRRSSACVVIRTRVPVGTRGSCTDNGAAARSMRPTAGRPSTATALLTSGLPRPGKTERTVHILKHARPAARQRARRHPAGASLVVAVDGDHEAHGVADHAALLHGPRVGVVYGAGGRAAHAALTVAAAELIPHLGDLVGARVGAGDAVGQVLERLGELPVAAHVGGVRIGAGVAGEGGEQEGEAPGPHGSSMHAGAWRVNSRVFTIRANA